MLNRKTFLPLNKYLLSLLISSTLYLCVISNSSAGTVEQRLALYTTGKSIVSSTTFSNLDEPSILEAKWDTENKNMLEAGMQVSNGYSPGPNTIMCMFFAIAYLILRRKEPAPKRKEGGLHE